ncbi:MULTISPECIES: autoinducer binding domain-containing protein [unclassified Serratia (in: enterobacteria)]|uniref:autoinducer binding domain-containing protein n=1 Tax=unclassified Serratia (in: enterobacteria) TaxID=2647522 RepID=UPI0030766F35
MEKWQEDMLSASMHANTSPEIFSAVLLAMETLGFEYFSYGIKIPFVYTQPQTIILSNYPDEWRQHYVHNNYQDKDPVVLHGMQSQKPFIWSDKAFSSATQLWDEAQSFGIRFGWSQSSFDALGIGGILSLSRSSNKLTAKELKHKEAQMRWLTHVAHLSFRRTLNARTFFKLLSPLSRRETEILKWTADGKSSQDISQILKISKNTVDFHVKNAIVKLQTNNKTAAVVRAAMLGLLYEC